MPHSEESKENPDKAFYYDLTCEEICDLDLYFFASTRQEIPRLSYFDWKNST